MKNNKATVLFFVYSNKYICANRIDGVREYAEKAGWRVQVVERNGAGNELDVAAILDFWKPIGVIAECGGGIPEISRKTLGDLPVVYLDEDPAGPKAPALFVNSNGAEIGETAAKELLSLDLANYAFVGWRQKCHWSEKRLASFKRALKLHGRDVAVFRAPPAAGDLQRREALAEWLAALPKPCGVFAVHDPVGEEILELASLHSIRVPEELAVIGVDNETIICERAKPTLSSIEIDFEHGGYMCAELLDKRIHNPAFVDCAMEYSPVCVVRRESTRRFPKTDWRVAKGLEFIRRNAFDTIGTDEVAAVMELSRRMAEIVFKRQVGHTIHEELTQVRMQKVERLLRNPRQDISAIAGLCGWSSGSVLRKLFKERHNGLSMREWRSCQFAVERLNS